MAHEMKGKAYDIVHKISMVKSKIWLAQQLTTG